MAESIGTARLDIVVDTSSLDAGVNKAKRSTEDLAKSSQQSSERMTQASKRQIASLERSISTFGKSRAEQLKWRIEQLASGKAASDLSAKLLEQVRRTELLERARKEATEQLKRLTAAEVEAQRKAAAGMSGQFRGVGSSLGGELRSLALRWAAVGASAGAAVVGINSFRNSVNFADQLNDINIRLGISAETLSGWAYAAKQTGTDVDGLGIGLRRLAKNMAEAADKTSEQGKLFKALGVDAVDPVTKKLRSLEDVLPEIASGFKGIQSETLKAALAQELFGKSGTDLIEFLNLGSDGLSKMQLRARELGVELSQGTLTAADKFNDTVNDLKAASQGFSTQLAAELLPALTKLTEHLTDMVKDGTAAADSADLVATAIDGVGTALNKLDGIGDVISGLTQGFTELLHAAGSVARLDFTTAANLFRNSDSDARIGAGLVQFLSGDDVDVPDQGRRGQFGNVISGSGDLQGRELALAQARMKRQKEAEDRLLGLFSEGSGKAKAAKKEGKTEAERELERLEAAYKSLAAQQRERIALFGVEGEAAKVRYELEHGELSKLTDAQAKKLGINKEELIVNAERLDQMREEAEFAKERERADKAHAERFITILDDMRTETELLGKSIEQQDEYIKLKYLGAEANEAERQAVIEGNKAYHERLRLISAQTDLMDTFRTEASSAISDVVNGTRSLSDAFKDMFDNIAERITQMIADRWIEQMFGQMGSTGGGTSGGDWIGQLFSLFSGDWAGGGFGFANGGAFDNGMPIRAFANGGIVDRATGFFTADGRANIMGEAGPEAIIPLETGRDGRLGVRAIGGGSVQHNNIEQKVYVQGRVDGTTLGQMARKTGSEAAREIARTGRR